MSPLCTSVHYRSLLCTTVCPCATPHTTVHHLFMNCHHRMPLCTTVLHCEIPCTTVHLCAPPYTTMHHLFYSVTTVYHCAIPCTTVHNCTPLCPTVLICASPVFTPAPPYAPVHCCTPPYTIVHPLFFVCTPLYLNAAWFFL